MPPSSASSIEEDVEGSGEGEGGEVLQDGGDALDVQEDAGEDGAAWRMEFARLFVSDEEIEHHILLDLCNRGRQALAESEGLRNLVQRICEAPHISNVSEIAEAFLAERILDNLVELLRQLEPGAYQQLLLASLKINACSRHEVPLVSSKVPPASTPTRSMESSTWKTKNRPIGLRYKKKADRERKTSRSSDDYVTKHAKRQKDDDDNDAAAGGGDKGGLTGISA